MAGSDSESRNEEQSVLQRIKDGESELFCDLVRDCQRAVYTAAFSILRNEADAEEISQEAIAKAWAALGRFRMESKFSTWLVQITINEARMRLRKDRKHQFHSIDDSIETGQGIYVPEQLIEWRRIPSKDLERKRMREALVRAFESMPEKYREIFLLRDVQGLTVAQSAKVAGITPATAKTRLLRARLRMRDLIAEKTPPLRNTPVVLRRAAANSCALVWRRVSDFVDGTINASIRHTIEVHLVHCRGCKSVVQGVRNVVELFGDPRLFPLPKGFSQRTGQKVRAHVEAAPRGARARKQKSRES